MIVGAQQNWCNKHQETKTRGHALPCLLNGLQVSARIEYSMRGHHCKAFFRSECLFPTLFLLGVVVADLANQYLPGTAILQEAKTCKAYQRQVPGTRLPYNLSACWHRLPPNVTLCPLLSVRAAVNPRVHSPGALVLPCVLRPCTLVPVCPVPVCPFGFAVYTEMNMTRCKIAECG